MPKICPNSNRERVFHLTLHLPHQSVSAVFLPISKA
nr:MAG TPA: hypothetical protein [Caudoviricetes sp.]